MNADQLQEIDLIAMEDFALGVLQRMENAGRDLVGSVRDMLDAASGEVTILAGSGGNGDGVLCFGHRPDRERALL